MHRDTLNRTDSLQDMESSADDDALFLRYLNLGFLSPVIVFGVLGNFLGILTWSRGCYRNTSTAALLIALAIADTAVLTIPALERWLHRVIFFMIRNDNIVTCKIWAFLSYFGPTISSWIIVIVTAERLVSIWFPLKVFFVCTRKKALFVVLGICLLMAALYLPIIINATLIKKENIGNQFYVNSTDITSYLIICDAPENEPFRNVYVPLLMWLDMGFLFIVPFLLIVIGNILILYKLYKSNTILTEEGHDISDRSKVTNSFTVQAITASATFFVCLFPVTCYQVAGTITEYRLPDYADDIIHILLYAKSAFNFIIYCAIGSVFRKSLKTVLGNILSRQERLMDHPDSSMNQTQESPL
ncbi:thyrotropin-releasing hormone receptor-like [Mercenaria mercenaria]|uniref:thyrotropin-releasing hormone receptor-like n=1 Tax=Mercenaria mercenaria TaxID=6596 RepID=UPI00234F9942|nr:thyrotropin-releasing hormone receptor-like [Mercenaria mercenaria]